MSTPPAVWRLDVGVEVWPLANPFTISRGTKTAADVVVVELSDGVHSGRGESVPYTRYGETTAGAVEAIRALGAFPARETLLHGMPAGAARNAVDCALWDLEARRAGTPVRTLAGLGAHSGPVLTAFTLSLDSPEGMAAKSLTVPNLRLLKLKLGGAGDAARMRGVRAARPDVRLIVDANEAWAEDDLPELFAAAFEAGVELIEQPLAAGRDAALAGRPRGIIVCADESVHTRKDLAGLAGLYDAINIKLDKAGGLTEALALQRAAVAQGFRIMVGSMVSTSLGVAPALLLADHAQWVDLDGPLLLKQDRPGGLDIKDGLIQPGGRGLWGSGVDY